MKKKQVYRIAAILGVAYLMANIIAISLGEYDFRLVKAGEPPRFNHKKRNMAVGDGGSKVYPGFGYDLWSIHQMHNEERRGDTSGHIVGPRIDYSFWVLWLDHQDTYIERNRNSKQTDGGPIGPNP